MALHREIDGAEPVRPQPVESTRAHRHAQSAWHLASGTLACPGCDAPVLPSAGGMSPGDPIACGYCGAAGPVRDFLSLAEPTRPMRVAVRVLMPSASTPLPSIRGT